MQKYWFKPKKYGYGLYPTSWQGLVATLGLLGLLFVSVYTNGLFQNIVHIKDILRFVLDAIILIVLFTLCFHGKTEGGLKWRWGNKK